MECALPTIDCSSRLGWPAPDAFWRCSTANDGRDAQAQLFAQCVCARAELCDSAYVSRTMMSTVLWSIWENVPKTKPTHTMKTPHTPFKCGLMESDSAFGDCIHRMQHCQTSRIFVCEILIMNECSKNEITIFKSIHFFRSFCFLSLSKFSLLPKWRGNHICLAYASLLHK